MSSIFTKGRQYNSCHHGPRQFSNNLPQGELKVPCTLRFEGAHKNTLCQSDVEEGAGKANNRIDASVNKEGNVASDVQKSKDILEDSALKLQA